MMGAFDGYRYGYGYRQVGDSNPCMKSPTTELADSLDRAFSNPAPAADHKSIVKRAARMKKPLPRFDFGKYNGRPVGDVFSDDPGYIVWCWENVNRRRLPFIEELYFQARAIVDEYEWDTLDDWALEIANDS